ncbi:MAG: NAD-dependent epimerase/dehydratase family protein, partial [Candidatus Rokuibacteriota bacterium]
MEGIPDTAYRGARVALLGATGFIGRWVARALCARGACVALLVRDRTTAQPVLARYGIDGRLVALDLHDLERAGLAIRALAPSITFNLAGYGINPAE